MQAILKIITFCALFLAIGTSAMVIIPADSTVSVPPAASTTVAVPPAANSTASVPAAATSTVAVPPAADSTASVSPAATTTVAVPPATDSTASVPPAATTTVAGPAPVPSVPQLTPMLIVDSVLFPTAAKIQIYVALAGTYTPQQEPCVDAYSNQVISRLADGGDNITSCIDTTGHTIKRYFLTHGAANISIEMAKCVDGPEPTLDCYVRTLCVFTTPKGGSVDSCVQAEPCVSDEVQSMQDYMDSAANELAQCYANN